MRPSLLMEFSVLPVEDKNVPFSVGVIGNQVESEGRKDDEPAVAVYGRLQTAVIAGLAIASYAYSLRHPRVQLVDEDIGCPWQVLRYQIGSQVLSPSPSNCLKYTVHQGLARLKAQQVHTRINLQGLTGNVVSCFQQPYHRIGYGLLSGQGL